MSSRPTAFRLSWCNEDAAPGSACRELIGPAIEDDLVALVNSRFRSVIDRYVGGVNSTLRMQILHAVRSHDVFGVGAHGRDVRVEMQLLRRREGCRAGFDGGHAAGE